MRKNKVTLTVSILITGIFTAAVILASCNKESGYLSIDYVDKIRLGKLIFSDRNLSNPVGQSCSSCHSPYTGFSDLNHRVVSEGAVEGRFVSRNAPGLSYAKFAPPLHFDDKDSTWVGGLFLDGRINTLEEQAKEPFLNPLEMNNLSRDMLIEKIKKADYYGLYKSVYGPLNDSYAVFNHIAEAIAAFENSPDLSPFTSRFDYYLKGLATLTDQQLRGFILFNGKAKCANCHVTQPDEQSGQILFTDFTYDNIGVPKNPANPFYTVPSKFNPLGQEALDFGLGGFLNDPANYGKFKVPSLRNAAVSAPYFHNGYFNTLKEVVHFYNKRDEENFPPPEIESTVNHEELGNLKLSSQDEEDIVVFINSLTDGYK